LIAAACGCNDPVFVPEHRPLETQPTMTAMGGTIMQDVDLFVLPVRRPTQVEQQLRDAEQKRLNLMRPVPWAGVRDFDIEVEWTLKNLDAQKVRAFFTMNGGNEFGDYVPSLYINPNLPANDQTPPPPLFGGAPIDLGANETQSGIFREDQFREVGVDLEAILRYPDPSGVVATPFEVLEHDSHVSTIGLAGVPAGDVTPAMVRFALTLTASGHVSLDYIVRVRDHAGKLAAPTAKPLFVNTAPSLAPPVSPMFTAGGVAN
jgi:hypothetical protein